MILKNRFKNRFVMRPLTGCNASYRYDFDQYHFRVAIMGKLDTIREREHRERMAKMNLDLLFSDIKKIYA